MMREAYPEVSEEEIWSKIGVVDTEHRRAKLYANLQFDDVRIGSFKHIDFTPPYTTAAVLPEPLGPIKPTIAFSF